MKPNINIVIIILLVICQHAFSTENEYDFLNRLTRVTYNNEFQIVYSYDEVGNRSQRIATNVADISIDGIVNFQDFVILASHWLETNCGYPDQWCEGADIDWSAEVGIEDLTVIAQYWLEGT